VIGGHDKLERLEIQNAISPISNVEFLRSLKRLRDLSLTETIVNGKPFMALREHDQLTEVSFEGCSLFDSNLETLEKMQNLIKLSLYKNPITDASIPILSKLKSLKKLNLRATFITDEGIKKLHSAMPRCTIENRPVLYHWFKCQL